jgi:acyl-CoA thioester hydrolase
MMAIPDPGVGAFDGKDFVFPVRVYYEDTDAAGIVYYANYLRFAERARTELLRNLGWEQRQLIGSAGLAFAVRSCTADFLSPARLDDRLEVYTRVRQVRGASMTADQIVRKGDADLVRLRVRVACVSSAGRPARIPGALRAALEDLCNCPEWTE